MKLRFFCDLCGTEVPRNTIRCPTCGRYFTAIQCPRCGYRGEEKDFAEGCPQCGYMKIPRADGSARAGSAGSRAKGKARRRRRTAVQSGAAPSSPVVEEAPLPGAPVGVYRLIGIILTLILIALLVILFLR
jgi:predicted RNA-binding Zn-ribbon protein involved in translation (DUF1610 family)